MYEKPKLIKAGKAGDVILGIAIIGVDLDGTSFDPDFETADDSESFPFMAE